jgi:uncharacterized membrane protein
VDTRLRISGHPIQPVLVTFPVGLFVCAFVFDTGRLLGAPVMIGELGYWTAVAGLVAAALTIVAGLVDLWDVPAGPHRRPQVTFTLVIAAMTAIFLLLCLMRVATPERGASGGMVLVELLALAVGGFAVRLGAGLTNRAAERAPEPESPDGEVTGEIPLFS